MKKSGAYLISSSSAIVSSLALSISIAHAGPDQHGSMHEQPMHGQPMHGQIEQKMFQEADSNRDGAISKKEFNAYQSKHFNKMDANRDGKITHAEMEAGHNKGRTSGATHLDQRFLDADANHDGGLDRTEAEKMPMLSMYFQEVDTNKNGKVTRKEYFDAMPLLHRPKPVGSGGKKESL